MNSNRKNLRQFAGNTISAHGSRSVLALILAFVFAFSVLPNFRILAEDGGSGDEYTDPAVEETEGIALPDAPEMPEVSVSSVYIPDPAPAEDEYDYYTPSNDEFFGYSDSRVGWKISKSDSEGYTRLYIYPVNGTSGKFQKNNQGQNFQSAAAWPWHDYRNIITEVIVLPTVKTANNTDLQYMFAYMNNLKAVNLTSFEIEGTRSLTKIFTGCTALETLDLSFLRTSNSSVVNINGLFKELTSLRRVEAGSMYLPYLQQANSLFEGCSALEMADLSGWDGAKTLYSLENVFANCTSLKVFVLNNSNFTTRVPSVDPDTGCVSYSPDGCKVQNFFQYCNALEYVDMSGITIGGRAEDRNGFGHGDLSGNSNINGLLQNRKALKTVIMTGIKLPGMRNLKAVFSGCTALEYLDFSAGEPFYNVVSMNDFVKGCTSLVTLKLDNVDNSSIGPKNNMHSIYSPDEYVNGIQDAPVVGAAEYSRDLGLKSCTSLVYLSVRNAKLWMAKDNAGIPGSEPYNAANDTDIFWWWYEPADNKIYENGRQLIFDSSVNESVKGVVLNKREYVDLITDRDGLLAGGAIPDETTAPATPAPTPIPPEPTEEPDIPDPYEGEGSNSFMGVSLRSGESDSGNMPGLIGTTDIGDRHTNINIINGDLNPNGPGFIAPGVYEITDELWNEEGCDMSGSAYGINLEGVKHTVEVRGSAMSDSSMQLDTDDDGINDIFIQKGSTISYISTTRRSDWTSSDNASYDPDTDSYTIDLTYTEGGVKKPLIAFVYKNAAQAQATGSKHDVRIEFTKVTFKNLSRIPEDPERGEHDFNYYVNTDGGGSYYRPIAEANPSQGIYFKNYVIISDPSTPWSEESSGNKALSGGSGTDIDFTIKISKPIEGTHFLFYTNDLDVPESQDWDRPYNNEPCYDNLPISESNFGIGGESFVVHDSKDSVGDIRLAPHSGLKVIENADSSREVITTGSDPSTSWSEFSVLAKATGSDFTWKSGIACSTSALKNAVTNKDTVEYLVYDFSNQIRYTLKPPTKTVGGVETVVWSEETGETPLTILGLNSKKAKTTATTKTINGFTFSKSGDNTIDIMVKSVSNKPVELYALVQCKAAYSDFELEWRKIVLIPATNVHYEETYMLFDGGGAGTWKVIGSAANPVYNLKTKKVTGKGSDRQSGENVLYGYDASYDAFFSKDSNGRSVSVTLNETAFNKVKAGTANWPSFSFSFTGSGFDIMGRTGLNTGIYVVNVTNSSGRVVKSQIVNTRYWGANNTNQDVENVGEDLYQVPIIHIKDLPHDSYTVNTQLIWMYGLVGINTKGMVEIPGIPKADYELIGFENETEPAKGYTYPASTAYVDAYRIYYPIDTTNLTEESNPIVYKAYNEAGEFKPMYREIRDLITDDSSCIDNVPGVEVNFGIAIDVTPHYIGVDADGDGSTDLDENGDPIYATDENGDPIFAMTQNGFTALDYKKWGPNNEMYLKKGQGFAFKLKDVDDVHELHVSAKAPFGSSKMAVTLAIVVENSQTGEKLTIPETSEFTVATATEMYYDLTREFNILETLDTWLEDHRIHEMYVVVHNDADNEENILSLCQIKEVELPSDEETDAEPSSNIVADMSTVEFAAAVIGGRKGDVNADGGIDLTDALHTMRSALDESTLGIYGAYCADVNLDYRTNMQDAIIIFRNVLG